MDLTQFADNLSAFVLSKFPFINLIYYLNIILTVFFRAMATPEEIDLDAQEAALMAALEEQYRLEEEALLEEEMRLEEELLAEEMALLAEEDPNMVAELEAERQAARLKEIVARNKQAIADKKKRFVPTKLTKTSFPLFSLPRDLVSFVLPFKPMAQFIIYF